MATPQAVSPEFFADMQSKALETVSVLAEMNHRVVQELVGLSASAAKEGMRAYAELQTATMHAIRATQPAAGPAEPVEALGANPFAWYQKSLLAMVEGSQKAFRLLEANGQIVTRSAERLQASADRTGQDIQEVLTSSVSRMKEIYG
ncbi:MAG TPA: hypothetical protein VLD61_01975 [Methylomirabilota bacterium]|nr:hypothetical protein [Methylomirabilota bacterium]